MISELGRKAVAKIMVFGCFLKIYPYVFDVKTYRLKRAPIWHLVIYHFRRYMVLITFSFMFVRQIQSLSQDIPSRIRIMNFIWVSAYSLVVLCNIQFEIRRGAILMIANSLFEELDRTRHISVPKKLTSKPAGGGEKGEEKSAEPVPEEPSNLPSFEKKEKSFDWVSCCVLISTFLLITNPPAHSTVLFDIPCAPQYMSSIVFDCKNAADDPAPIWQKGLFVLLENWIISDMMFAWTFNWALSFLAMTWMKLEMQRFEGTIAQNQKTPLDFDIAVIHYRRVQVMLQMINDAFRLYLQFFPSVLFTIAAMLLFGAARYTSLPFHAYIVFPFCGIRCIFEAGTALGAAGFVNQESKNYMLQWDREVDRIEDKEYQKYLRKFRKSCADLKAMAGSLYSFENSIFLVSLSNCIQLTFTMFVTFKTTTR